MVNILKKEARVKYMGFLFFLPREINMAINGEDLKKRKEIKIMSIKYMIKNFTKEANNVSYEKYSQKIRKLMKDYKTIYVYPKYDDNKDIIGIDVVVNAKLEEIEEIENKIKKILSI